MISQKNMAQNQLEDIGITGKGNFYVTSYVQENIDVPRDGNSHITSDDNNDLLLLIIMLANQCVNF